MVLRSPVSDNSNIPAGVSSDVALKIVKLTQPFAVPIDAQVFAVPAIMRLAVLDFLFGVGDGFADGGADLFADFGLPCHFNLLDVFGDFGGIHHWEALLHSLSAAELTDLYRIAQPRNAVLYVCDS